MDLPENKCVAHLRVKKQERHKNKRQSKKQRRKKQYRLIQKRPQIATFKHSSFSAKKLRYAT
ncbi:hypothetical protein PBAL39_13767 [Pedobacter sp. BAL39]|nr:hypothetical protein PBAL39_13767 [Pedobacter sp. BAL39]